VSVVFLKVRARIFPHSLDDVRIPAGLLTVVGSAADTRRKVKIVVRKTGQRRLDSRRQMMDVAVIGDVVT